MPTMTAQQRREFDKRRYDAYLAECPARDVLKTLSDKWVTLVVNALADGPRRYSDLARIVAGVSQKMLTQTLRTLERDGFVSRRVTPTVPVRVDYELTRLGHDFVPIVQSIKTWSERHIHSIHSARASFDAAPTAAPAQVTAPFGRPQAVR